MNKKQVTCSALAAMMFAGTTGFTAFAAMPDATVLIKDKAYALDYAENTANRAEIIKQLGQLAEGEQAILKLNNKWLNNDKTAADTTKIPAVTYKDKDGKETKYEAKDGAAVEEGDFKVVEISAVGAKKLQVNFNKPVEDASKLTYSIKRDGATVGIVKDSAVWNEDKTQVTLTTTYNLMTGNYVVAAKYADGTETKAEAKIEEAKMTTIEMGENAVYATTGTAINMNKVSIPVNFLNQYGEEIKNPAGSFTVSPNYGKAAIENGRVVLEMTGNSIGFRLGEKIQVTVIYNDGKSVLTESKEVVVSEAAKIASVELGAVTTEKKDYKDKEIFKGNLDEATVDVNDPKKITIDKEIGGYYIPVTVKDQYGAIVKDIDEKLVSLSSTNSEVALKFERDIKNGEHKIKVVRNKGVSTGLAGEVTITMITGSQVATSKFELKNNAALTSIKFNQPEKVLIPGKTVALTYTAVDQYGTELKKDKEIVPNGGTQLSGKAGYYTTLNLKGEINGIANQNVVINVSGGAIVPGVNYDKGSERTFELYANPGATQVIVTVVAGTNTQTLVVNTVADSKVSAITDLAVKSTKSGDKTAYNKLQENAEFKLTSKVRDQYDNEMKDVKAEYGVTGATLVDATTNTYRVDAGVKEVVVIAKKAGAESVEMTLGVVSKVDRYDVSLNKEVLFVGEGRLEGHNIVATPIGYVGDHKVLLAAAPAVEDAKITSDRATITTSGAISVNGAGEAVKTDGTKTTATYIANVGGDLVNKTVTITNESRKEQGIYVERQSDEVEVKAATSGVFNKAKLQVEGLVATVKDQYGVEMQKVIPYVKKDGKVVNAEIAKDINVSDKLVLQYVSNGGTIKEIEFTVSEVK